MQLIDRALVALDSEPIPGLTGVRYRLADGPRPLTISVAGVDEVVVTVGCRAVRFTAEEAAAIAQDMTAAAKEATVGRT